MKISLSSSESKQILFLLCVCFLFFLLRLPSLYEPLWYGDEGVYQVLGRAMNEGRLLYRDIWDNKTPLLYVLYQFVNADQFLIRLLSLCFGIGALISLFFLANKLFSNRFGVYSTTLFFTILFGIPMIEGNIANAENFMLFPILLAGYLIYSHQFHSKKILFSSGILLSLAFLTKIVGVFDFAAFFIFLLFSIFRGEKLQKKNLVAISFFPLGFFVPIAISFLFFLISNGVSDFVKAAFFSNVGYVGYGNSVTIIPGFTITQGFLIIKLFLLGLFVLCLFLIHKRIPQNLIFILLWIGFSLFNAFFSQRPYTHYVLTLLAPISLLIGTFFIPKVKLYTLCLFAILLILIKTNFWISDKTVRYYQNFSQFLFGTITVDDYRGFFDRKTPRDYHIASYLNPRLKKTDSVFIWGDNPQLYTLLNKLPPGKFTVSYHMKANKTTLTESYHAIQKVNPRYIIITSPKKNPYLFPLDNYQQKLTIGESAIYERIY